MRALIASSWYLADEPGGSGIAPETLQPKYDAVKKADPSRPVSMVFCTDAASKYLSMLDVISPPFYSTRPR